MKNTITITLNPETTKLINGFLPKKNAEINVMRKVLKEKGTITKEQENAMCSVHYDSETGSSFTFGVDTQFVKDFADMIINSIPAFITIACSCKTWSNRLKDWVDKAIVSKTEKLIIEKGDVVTIYYATGTGEVEKVTFVIGDKKFNEHIEDCLEGRGLGMAGVYVPFMNTKVKMEIYVDSITKAKDVNLGAKGIDPETKISSANTNTSILEVDSMSKFDDLLE